ncbi:MAG TPA: phosphate signaling complex protein PhoU [Gemmatimonadaceae bacterium]|nr:phosphate signaling complex protein PhoU [Gemmatimonadaceae bacterium]
MSRDTGYRHFHDQLDALKQQLIDMSQHAEQLIELSVESLVQRDAEKAQAVIKGDHVVDALEINVEQAAIALLALQQPLARDLRYIISAIKVSGDLERVGDHGVNIAESALRLARMTSSIAPSREIEEMAKRARDMLRDALDAYVRADGSLGRAVCRADDEVDTLHDSVFAILLAQMTESPATVQEALELLLVSRNLERIADLATNIGEDAVYLAEGKQIKHHFEERSSTPAA